MGDSHEEDHSTYPGPGGDFDVHRCEFRPAIHALLPQSRQPWNGMLQERPAHDMLPASSQRIEAPHGLNRFGAVRLRAARRARWLSAPRLLMAATEAQFLGNAFF